MHPFRFRRYWGLTLLAIPLAFAIMSFHAPAPAALTEASATSPPVAAAPFVARGAPASVPPTNPPPTSPPPVIPPTLAATATPSVEPTPTRRPAGTAPRVGLQVGHWNSNQLPGELARLRTSTGAVSNGYTEPEVNQAIAQRVAALLESQGIKVDILPATVPVDYDADAFVAIHADGSASAGAHGFKIATPWRTSRASQQLLDALSAEYAAATGLAWDDAITFNMRGYYAFNYRRYDHAVAKTTPSVIIETGFLTSAADRTLLIGQPDRVAAGIARGIISYLGQRDPSDGAALLPPEYKTQRAISLDGIDVRAAPRDNAPVLLHAEADRRFNPLFERDGWYQVFVGTRERRTLGWVRKDQLVATNDPTPTPPPATDP